MDMDLTKIERLIALKRFERPRPGFLEDVEHEFHHRLRAEMLKAERHSLRGLIRGFAQGIESVANAFGEPLRAFRALGYVGAGALAAWALVAAGPLRQVVPAVAQQDTASESFAFSAATAAPAFDGQALSLEANPRPAAPPVALLQEAADLAYGASVTLLDGNVTPSVAVTRASFVF